jgi:membrane protein involved in colicin uptake
MNYFIKKALSMTFAQLFTTPLGTIGESLSQFFAGTMRHVPILLWPVIIILILFIVVVLILMYSRYEVHLPFMMGSLRPSPHAAVITPTNVVEQIENSSNHSTNYIQELENKVQKLQLELQQKNLQLEHNTTLPITHNSRSSSIERTNQQRQRSSSNRRSNTEDIAENELRQRTISPNNIGFRKDFFPD